MIVVIAADDDHRAVLARKFPDRGIKEIFRLGRRKISIEHVPRDQYEFHPLALAKSRDFTQNFPLFADALAAQKPLADMPVGRVQNLHSTSFNDKLKKML